MTKESVPGLSRMLESGVPAEALTFYGRWWQLENWLRETVYVELRAKYGSGWEGHLHGRSPKRAASDTANSYMASADAGELLAYADVSDLFQLIDSQWELFAPLLPPQRRWHGTSDELKDLRNRNAHCRRPHRDDVARIEQVLRDLETGAQRFYCSYLDTEAIYKSKDPLARLWINHRHETAARLHRHAEDKYGVRFRLSYNTRPWATMPDKNAISGIEGAVWHARWIIEGRTVNVADLWRAIVREPRHSDLIIHLLVDLGHVTATFAAVDGADAIADAIGHVFDEILINSNDRAFNGSVEEWAESWTRGAELLPRCVQADSLLTRIDPLNPDVVSVFGAKP